LTNILLEQSAVIDPTCPSSGTDRVAWDGN